MYHDLNLSKRDVQILQIPALIEYLMDRDMKGRIALLKKWSIKVVSQKNEGSSMYVTNG